MSISKWLIVSNRLPVKVENGKLAPSSGGLVSAIMGIRRCPELVWAGALSGEVDEREFDKFGTFSPLPIVFDESLYKSYYNGFCNSVLWPLLHYESERVHFDKKQWESYEKVNKLFAEKICENLTGEEIVWVHDFHLFLLPKLIKEVSPKTRVGFFLHTPFPSSEIYRQLPVRSQLLEGVLYSDLVGFHDYSYLRHFVSSVEQVLGINSNLLTINYKNHTAQLGVFPVSIDTDKFVEVSSSEQVQKACAAHKDSGDKTRLVLGVDRLDYIKGIKLKLQIFSKLLEKYPEIAGRVSLVQLAVPSRTEVKEYLELKQEVERMVGEINGQFGTAHYSPVRYIFGEMKFEDLVALYRYSDALLVTSKRDGMNLVCLEYLACQNAEQPGVLVLSEFAGASATLAHAFQINPWDCEGSADSLYEALLTDYEERAPKFKDMLNYLKGYTATDWAESFIGALVGNPENFSGTVAQLITKNSYRKALESTTSKSRLILFLDFDGTLAPISDYPQDVYLDDRQTSALRQLSDLPMTDVIVVSGRDEAFLKSRLSGLNVGIASEHGSAYFDAITNESQTLLRSEMSQWQDTVFRVMENYCRRVPESFIEKKKFGIAWHYRKSPVEFSEYQARRLHIDLEGALRGLSACVLAGSKVVEVRASEANKGSFVDWYLENYTFKGEPVGVIGLGDDVTDEDMFRSLLSQGAVAIKVGRVDTLAQYCISSQSEVRGLLEELASMRSK